MITLRTATAVKSTIALLADNQLRSLLTERLHKLTNAWEDIDVSDLTHFLIIQPGDTAGDAEHELGWSLLKNTWRHRRDCYGHFNLQGIINLLENGPRARTRAQEAALCAIE